MTTDIEPIYTCCPTCAQEGLGMPDLLLVLDAEPDPEENSDMVAVFAHKCRGRKWLKTGGFVVDDVAEEGRKEPYFWRDRLDEFLDLADAANLRVEVI